MPFRLIVVSFAKCENCIEVAVHERMTLTQRMAHVRTEVHKKVSFNLINPDFLGAQNIGLDRSSYNEPYNKNG